MMLMAFLSFAQSCPDNNHPHMIDLGLPSGTKWACCNVDTEHPENQSPTNYGSYYAWGEIEEKEIYDWTSYIYCNGTPATCQNLGYNICGTQYDVAHVKWGGDWQMPTLNQIKELVNNCDYEPIMINGMKGGKYTGSNGNSIIMPFSGYRCADETYVFKSYGTYWSGNMETYHITSAYDLSLNEYGTNWEDYSSNCYSRRSDGKTVRPVVGKDAQQFVDVVLSTYYINFIEGEQVEIDILSGNGLYSAESINPDIASVVIIEQSKVEVTALNAGKTTIVVKDINSKQKVKITVTVAKRIDTLSCPDDHHPHMIDLGLPSGTLWACCNVGATKPEDEGGYYAWGETEEKEEYTPETYLYCHETDDTNAYQFWNKYYDFDDIGNPIIDWYGNYDISGTQYDVAHMKWGGDWLLPSYPHLYELRKCRIEWAGYKGMKGVLFVGLNGKSIFLPAAGYRHISSLYNAGKGGYYWLGTSRENHESAISLDFYTDNNPIIYFEGFSSCTRSEGYSVRPIISGTTSINLPKSSAHIGIKAIYNIYGIKVAVNTADINTLPPGIYIVNGKKMLVK